jgi:hypothetical protein
MKQILEGVKMPINQNVADAFCKILSIPLGGGCESEELYREMKEALFDSLVIIAKEGNFTEEFSWAWNEILRRIKTPEFEAILKELARQENLKKAS